MVCPLVVLRDRGYMMRMLDDEVPPKYITFLAQLLKRPFDELGTELGTEPCRGGYESAVARRVPA